MNCTVDYSVFGRVADHCGQLEILGYLVSAVLVAAAIILIPLAVKASKKASGDYVETPGGHLISKEYLKDVERLRRKAREQAHHSHAAPASGAALPDGLTEREAALVQKFVAELRREQSVSAADRNHAEPLSGSATRKPSTRRNPRSFQDWQGAVSHPTTTSKVREHRTVQ